MASERVAILFDIDGTLLICDRLACRGHYPGTVQLAARTRADGQEERLSRARLVLAKTSL
jgi:hypothetical protein